MPPIFPQPCGISQRAAIAISYAIDRVQSDCLGISLPGRRSTGYALKNGRRSPGSRFRCPIAVYRESAGYRPGVQAVLADTPFGKIGMTVCYDLRFPQLYRCLAQAGAEILTVPAAFNHITGAAHWEVLLHARAIETGCYVLAPAQTGFHPETAGKGRRTHGHSLVISPWGDVLADGGINPGVTFAEMDLAEVAKARGRIPSLHHDRPIVGP